ncbi:hypothetical protein BEN49_13155 [Hymenobacter coccineus]|uniref:Uncharacterized protein n=2 Tax=Hymenobacter coccineus TaxID=1908235 RepID=A0A1G1SW98_9BACT|nr:hypothetical protein BEN49_13155 [Hymenobacter coccineus]
MVKLRNTPDGSAYEASEMSDGERIAFYLIGQCLAAPIDSIIVVDEPEIHLNRVIQARLWDAIERTRPDCLFIYLTHDLEFAASRIEAKKIWIKSFNEGSWDWKIVPSESEGLPEEVLLAVLGSRKPVLFTEGEKGGLEQAIFSRVYPDRTIMPRGGCDKVIEATQAFKALQHLHGIECYGIIDLDYRSPQQVAGLLEKGVYVLDMQEMENLLLVEPVLHLLATHASTHGMTADQAAVIVYKVKEFAFETLTRDVALLASRRTAWELETKLHKIDRRAIGVAMLEQARVDATQFDIAGTYAAFEQQLNQILTAQDYAALLRIYNNKGLTAQVGRYFGTPSYPDLIKRLISKVEHEAVVEALRAASPMLPPVPAFVPISPILNA